MEADLKIFFGAFRGEIKYFGKPVLSIIHEQSVSTEISPECLKMLTVRFIEIFMITFASLSYLL